MSELVIHLSRRRYEAIAAQGYGYQPCVSRHKSDVVGGEEVEFHLLSDESAFCGACGKDEISVKAETPTDIQRIKYQMFPSKMA